MINRNYYDKLHMRIEICSCLQLQLELNVSIDVAVTILVSFNSLSSSMNFLRLLLSNREIYFALRPFVGSHTLFYQELRSFESLITRKQIIPLRRNACLKAKIH